MEDDIVKRLLKVAAVSEIIKDNPKIYYDAAHEITRLRERLAEADEANRRVSDANEKLRDAYDTDALTISYNLGYTCGKDIAKDRIESAEQAYVRLDASMNRLQAAFRVNMLRAFPHMSHDEIDAEIEAAIRESGDE